MATPAGAVQQFVPDLPQILSSTRLLEPGQTVTIQFRAPGQPGDYPYRVHVPRPLAGDERGPDGDRGPAVRAVIALTVRCTHPWKI